ncbi:YdjY domain-containing protein [Campylobacter corcagiensis]|uniref:4Fe-4S ferredoxin-type domain-containing protein n=1 Tax=Campylobacter corcagiensis TaxID=1448857 RepID=A0A7M1LFI5_9BACT|nr:YdjY domain-containing protein [Campylobacter corcagiensis]QKF64745.1 hypothetical protein CCORG_0891 [Campylobacter corcagiensis]QOQ87091.1 hypothetical protein IMC76_07720 [Campylobacter corcagiensis]
MKKLLLIFAALFIVGCSNPRSDLSNVNIEGVSLDNPLLVNSDERSVTVFGSVNEKYLGQSTRHAVVFDEGKFGNKAIFYGYANQLDFYKALIDLGAKAGNNMFKPTASKTNVEGDKIKVEVKWEGANRWYDINEVIIDSNSKPIDMRFGGNQKASSQLQTGCIACLDSCPVGIISNHTYTYEAVEKRKEVEFRGNPELLSSGGVAIKFSVI